MNFSFSDSVKQPRRRRFRPLRALFMLVAFAFNLLLLTGVVLYLLNDDHYRKILIWSTDQFLDTQLEINGDFSLGIGRVVELHAEDVRLQAIDGSYAVSLDKINIEQRFASYISTGTFWINSLHMEGLDADVRESIDEEPFDWDSLSLPFLVIEEIQLRDLSVVYTELSQDRHTYSLSHVSVDDTGNEGPVKVSAAGKINDETLQLEGTLGSLEQLRSAHRNYPVDLTLSRTTTDDGNDNPQNRPAIQIDGKVTDTPSGSILLEASFDVVVPELVPILTTELDVDQLGHLQGSLSIAEVDGRWSVRETRFAATDTDQYQLQVDGRIDETGQFDLNSEFGVSNTADFGARFGVDLDGYGPVEGKGSLLGNFNRFNYHGKLSIGRIETEATLTASFVQQRPAVSGKLNVSQLYLADLGIHQRLTVPAAQQTESSTSNQSGATTAAVSENAPETGEADSNAQNPLAKTPAEKEAKVSNADANSQAESGTKDSSADREAVFDRDPVDLSGLQQVDLDLEIVVDQIIGDDFSFDKLTGQIKLKNGNLQVTPLRLTFAGGHADLELAVNSVNTPGFSLKITADDLNLGGVVPHQQENMQVAGNAKLHVDINTRGHSIDEMFTNLSGDMKLALGQVRLPKRYVDYWSGEEPTESGAVEAYTMLELDGNYAANFGKDIDLSAEAVHIRANDGSYDLTVGEMNLRQNIDLYLQKGDWWIENLLLSDMQVVIVEAAGDQENGGAAKSTVKVTGAEVEATESPSQTEGSSDTAEEVAGVGAEETASSSAAGGATAATQDVANAEQRLPETETLDHDWHEFDWDIADWPFILVEKMQVTNVSVKITAGEQTDNYSLNSLILDNENSDEPLQLTAAGAINELALNVEGTVGTPAEPRGKKQAYPVEYSLSSGPVGSTPGKPVMQLSGTVDRSRPGDSRIEAEFDVDITELMSIVEPNRPEGKLISAIQQERTGVELGHLQGSLKMDENDGRWGIEEVHVVSSETDLYQLTFDGSIDEDDVLEVKTEIEVPDPPAFGEAFGIDLTGYAAYKGKGVVTGNRTRLNYVGETLTGKTENKLTLVIVLAGGKPTITGKFTSPNVYLPDYGIDLEFAVKEGEVLDRETGKMVAPEELEATEDQDSSKKRAPPGVTNENTASKAKTDKGSRTAESATTDHAKTDSDTSEDSASASADKDTDDSQFIFGREPFDFSGLQKFNLEMEIVIEELSGADFKIDQVEGKVSLTDGVLHVSPMRLTLEGGTTDIDLLLDTRTTPTFTFKVLADDLELGKSIAALQEVVPVEGNAHLNVDISGRGYSAHEMAASLSGKTSFSLEDAKIPKVYVEYLNVDVFGWVTRTVIQEDSYYTISCTMSNFNVEQGVATSQLLFADGPQLSIEGVASLDLGQETMDMTLHPTQKNRVTSGSSTIRIYGALADPDVDSSTSKAGTAAVVGGALIVPQVVIPVFLVEQLWKRVFSSDETKGCAEFVAEHEEKQRQANQAPKEPKRHPGR